MAQKLIEIDYSDFEDVKKAAAILPKEAAGCMMKALNRTVDKTISFTQDAVADRYAVKRKGVKETMKTKRATRQNLEAVIESQDRRLKISHFPFSAVGKQRIARVQIRTGSKVLSTSSPPLFVGRANATSGKREVFTRPEDKRYKVTYGFTLAIPQMIENEEVWEKIAEQSSEFLYKRFQHEWEYKLTRIAAELGLKG